MTELRKNHHILNPSPYVSTLSEGAKRRDFYHRMNLRLAAARAKGQTVGRVCSIEAYYTYVRFAA